MNFVPPVIYYQALQQKDEINQVSPGVGFAAIDSTCKKLRSKELGKKHQQLIVLDDGLTLSLSKDRWFMVSAGHPMNERRIMSGDYHEIQKNNLTLNWARISTPCCFYWAKCWISRG